MCQTFHWKSSQLKLFYASVILSEVLSSYVYSRTQRTNGSKIAEKSVYVSERFSQWFPTFLQGGTVINSLNFHDIPITKK